MTRHAGPPAARKRRHRVLIALAVLLAAVGALAGLSFIETRSLRTHEMTFTSADVPVAFDGLRIAFVSDLHVGPYLSQERARRVVQKVNETRPDLIVLGGDYAYRDAEAIAPAFAELSRLRAPLGVYGVLGNHDHWLDAAAALRAMDAAAIQDLDNQGVWVQRGSARIRLCGVDDLWEGDQDLVAALGDATGDDFVLLVSHNPDYAETLTPGQADLVLSGHTHGGQVTFFGLWAPFVPSEHGQKYRAGLVDETDPPVLVTTGVGTTVVPVRLFARPEIVLLTLRRD